MRYPGGKAGPGVYQRIICQMPPHDVYVEPFLGGGAVMRYKRLARLNVGIDLDGAVVQRAADLARAGEWISRSTSAGSGESAAFEFLHQDGVAWLARWTAPPRTLVYCDPPYLMSARSSQQRKYRCELSSADHARLLEVVQRLPCMVMVSGYPSEVYDLALSSWRVIRYRTMTHGGPRTECLWMNYLEPAELHDYGYLGEGFRERERIRRMQARWRRRLAVMPSLERYALLSAIRARL